MISVAKSDSTIQDRINPTFSSDTNQTGLESNALMGRYFLAPPSPDMISRNPRKKLSAPTTETALKTGPVF